MEGRLSRVARDVARAHVSRHILPHLPTSAPPQFAETLAGVGAGVRRPYGIVGDSLNGLTDAIRRQGKTRWRHVRHEEVAAFAAGGEAHLMSELAVCAGSCGPGNLHLIIGLFDRHRSRVPVLAALLAFAILADPLATRSAQAELLERAGWVALGFSSLRAREV